MLSRLLAGRAAAIGCARLASTSSSGHTPDRFKGKVAVVTGSTAGIGLCTVEQLAQQGASVVINSRTQEKVDNVVKDFRDRGFTATGITCQIDVAEDRTNLLEHTLKEHGRIDMLVCNAGVSPAYGNFFKTTEEQWDKLLNANVKGNFFLVKDALPELSKTNGSVVLMSTMFAYFPQPALMLGAYSLSKAAVLAMVKAMSPWSMSKGVRVNGVAPGLVKTDFSQALQEHDHTRDIILGAKHIKRLAEPEEIASAILFLLSDDSKYITGETLAVAGGYPSRL